MDLEIPLDWVGIINPWNVIPGVEENLNVNRKTHINLHFDPQRKLFLVPNGIQLTVSSKTTNQEFRDNSWSSKKSRRICAEGAGG